MAKYVYSFKEGNASMRNLLGGKGANLAEMTGLGLPVPRGFTITTEACIKYYSDGRTICIDTENEINEMLSKTEKEVGKVFGDPENPFLVSVRSGARASMPGMMDTILNLGLNDKVVEGLAKLTGNERFAYDSYRRFIQMFSDVVMGVEKSKFEKILDNLKKSKNVEFDTGLTAEDLKIAVKKYKELFRKEKDFDFPQDPKAQLMEAVKAVFKSWDNPRAIIYRRLNDIPGDWGTAVNVQEMVYGNMGNTSGTGVAFTRNPATGENKLYGEFLMNAQGEDVVAGIRTPQTIDQLRDVMPDVYEQFSKIATTLEKHYKDMQDIEFTVEEGKLYILQCRSGKRSPGAAFRIAVDMVKEKLISKKEALLRITDKEIEGLFYPVIDPKITRDELNKHLFAAGIAAVPGAATGKVVFSAKEAEDWASRSEKVILVRKETSPEDVGGMHAAQGILTATGGKTSHAAVVARGWGKCCIVGCEELAVDYIHKTAVAGNKVLREGDEITINGSTGEVFQGALHLIKPQLPDAYYTIMKWADEIRKLKVRTNVDTPYDAENAIRLGAEGIGLCRTEHMFFDTDERRLAIQEMIVADNLETRKTALAKLLPFQRDDFKGIFKAMDGKHVTIRLIDPPLHEFVPHTEPEQKHLAEKIGVPFEQVRRRVERLKEANPMLGHRGCRLCITYPEILEMQVRAIIEAACECVKEGIKVHPEIMHPLVIDGKELKILETKLSPGTVMLM